MDIFVYMCAKLPIFQQKEGGVGGFMINVHKWVLETGIDNVLRKSIGSMTFGD